MIETFLTTVVLIIVACVLPKAIQERDNKREFAIAVAMSLIATIGIPLLVFNTLGDFNLPTTLGFAYAGFCNTVWQIYNEQKWKELTQCVQR